MRLLPSPANPPRPTHPAMRLLPLPLLSLVLLLQSGEPGRSPGNQNPYSDSKMPAAPMPVPMHIVTMPYFCWRRRRPCSSVAVRIAPVAPSG